MHYGIVMFPADSAIRIDELAREVEARGFESLWVPEHTHMPVNRANPFPPTSTIGPEYWRSADPFVALTMAAAVTTRLRLGTAICLVTQRDPIITAKEVASLDWLSQGRFLFGIGAGWNVEEIENHGTVFRTRFRLMKERVLAMKAMWTKDEAEFHGHLVRFDPLWLWPKPTQKPHPPILLGGHHTRAYQRVVDYCDGWLPRGVRGADVVVNGMAEIRALAEQAGRDPRTISTTVSSVRPERADLDSYQAAGVERVMFRLPSAPRDTVLPLLDQYATLADQSAQR